jgi:hypothetical protein
LFQKINQTKPDQFSSRKKNAYFLVVMMQTRYFHVAYINYFVTSNGVKKPSREPFRKKERIELSKKEEEKKRGF